MPDSATELIERPADEVAESEIADVQPDELVAADLLVEVAKYVRAGTN